MNEPSRRTPFLQKKRIASLWLFTIVSLLVLGVSRPPINEAGGLDIVLDLCGSFLVLIGVFGRLWSILYIGGRKNHQLVTTGPYSITRNPLYFFSVVAIFGISLMFGSVLVAVAVPLVAFGIFSWTARREARYLQHLFGPQYSRYAQVTPLFWPKLSLMRSPSEIEITVGTLQSTLRDALFFIVLLPVMELLEYLRVQEHITALVTIP
ncbi:isoprenylcysteine carboxylmethyltransferase family protein [Pararhizobium sp. BT-229]|uniref:methyltransferase family protein n=1 Tax=Pararhizobium sp. BT-229 TaxID=2986923 RepID=UPI0021F7D445|nr:isoprenylcysteine carboxylmethyltransferase family protein [Pararhizobium sp. BT-229]MCV9963166.1 isoprenylcysteine carboxylmethyltransferase family protein [Pararhizobium sp. BT-229]